MSQAVYTRTAKRARVCILCVFDCSDVFARAPREAMASLLDYVDTKYGGLGNYMSHIGFREQQQQRLRDLLTRTDWP